MKELKRKGDWAARLHKHIDAGKTKAFDWAEHNCGCHWAAGAVKAVTGKNLAAEYDAKTAKGLMAAMKSNGFKNVADLVASKLPEIAVSQAVFGDIAAIPVDDGFGFTLGIVNGETILVLREDGLGIMPLFSAKRAFKVG